jgi:competence protein ComEC
LAGAAPPPDDDALSRIGVAAEAPADDFELPERGGDEDGEDGLPAGPPSATPDDIRISVPDPNAGAGREPALPARYAAVERSEADEDVFAAPADLAVDPDAETTARLAAGFEVRAAYAPVRRPWMPRYQRD